MTSIPTTSTQTAHGRCALRDHLRATPDPFTARLPKIELHVHIEGTLTPELRWQLAQRNNLPISMGKDKPALRSLEHVQQAYRSIISSAQLPDYAHLPPPARPPTFFEAYYSGCDVLRTSADFSDLALAYFQRCAAANVRYCEVFFDPQSHTARGVSWPDMMRGLHDAQHRAASELRVETRWVVCFLRDSSPEDAMEHYRRAVQYKDMIVGFGLDSNEAGRPPMLFEEVFRLARRDGFRITAHCDVGQRDAHENIRQVAAELGGEGADRVDHGLDAADKKELVDLLLSKGVGLTLCPWAYLRRWGYESTASKMRTIFQTGIPMCISSDSPAYQDDCWVVESLLLTRRMCGLSDEEVLAIMKASVEMSWAEPAIKANLLRELATFSQGSSS